MEGRARVGKGGSQNGHKVTVKSFHLSTARHVAASLELAPSSVHEVAARV